VPGPDPNPNAVRRNVRVGLVQLPSEGRKKNGKWPPAPKWPLPPDPRLAVRIKLLEDDIEVLEERDLDEGLQRTERTKLTRLRERLAVAEAERDTIVAGELEIWRELWRTPQAVQWERLRWNRGVALYARHQAAAEVGSMDDSKEARQRAHQLGLTPSGMKALMWVVVEDELGQRRPAQAAATGTEGRPARPRLAAVDEPEA